MGEAGRETDDEGEQEYDRENDEKETFSAAATVSALIHAR